jgi:hypothetical protein
MIEDYGKLRKRLIQLHSEIFFDLQKMSYLFGMRKKVSCRFRLINYIFNNSVISRIDNNLTKLINKNRPKMYEVQSSISDLEIIIDDLLEYYDKEIEEKLVGYGIDLDTAKIGLGAVFTLKSKFDEVIDSQE